MKTMKKLSTAEQKRVNKIYNSLPDNYRKLGIASEKAILFLMNEQGYSQEKAEDCVLEILEESKPYLEKGLFSTTIKSIELIFS